nr:hypothetical protein [Candidatus Freyarchaeota archaeon]
MLGYRAIYLLPAVVVLIAFILYLNLLSSYNNNIISFQIFWITFTGHFLGDPWFITLKNLFPNAFGQRNPIVMLLDLFYDPTPLVLFNPPIIVLSLCEIAIAIPTTIIFYYLAWTNRSGRSLGFALFITMLILWGFMAAEGIDARSLPVLSLLLLANMFLALGIFGIYDRLMKKEPKKSR